MRAYMHEEATTEFLAPAGIGEPPPRPTQTMCTRIYSLAVRITAKADYAVRVCIELAVAASRDGGPTKGEALADAQAIPLNFLENILGELRHAGVVRTQRGAQGGYLLARPAGEITVADVIRAVEGPLASVRGQPPEEVTYTGAAAPLQHVWIAVRANLRAVVERVTLEDLAAGRLPDEVERLAANREAWVTR